MFLRERMRPYTERLMREAHEKGSPVIRPLFYGFPEDKKAWEVEDQYLYGADILVAPILYAEQRERRVYLPEGVNWTEVWTGKEYEGGQTITVDAPIDQIPLFVKRFRIAGSFESLRRRTVKVKRVIGGRCILQRPLSWRKRAFRQAEQVCREERVFSESLPVQTCF